MTMIERVARALHAQHRMVSHSYEDLARAAIAAMREPTEAMSLTGSMERRKFLELNVTNTDRIYKAMIDAALKEKP